MMCIYFMNIFAVNKNEIESQQLFRWSMFYLGSMNKHHHLRNVHSHVSISTQQLSTLCPMLAIYAIFLVSPQFFFSVNNFTI